MIKWEAVFFDFDGVICDSVNIKTEAFAELYRPYGADIEKSVISYHLANGGVSRYEKFSYWHKEYLNIDLNSEQLKILSDKFSHLVLKKIIEAPFVEGVTDTLKALKDDTIPAYIVSGTPHEEINYIIETKKLRKYFYEVYGSPRKKYEIVKDILDREKYAAEKCIFIGDAMSDYEAALVNKLKFLGIVPNGEKSIFPEDTYISSIVHIIDYEDYV